MCPTNNVNTLLHSVARLCKQVVSCVQWQTLDQSLPPATLRQPTPDSTSTRLFPTSVRRAIITVIAQLWPAEITLGNRPEIPATGDLSMTTAAGSLQIVPQSPPSAPELRAADQGVADALESVLSDNTRRVYGAQWRLLHRLVQRDGVAISPGGTVDRCALPGRPRRGSGASIATMRLAASAIAKAHEWAKLESPCRDPGVRASLKGWGRPAGQTPAAGRRPHRRCARRHPAHRRPAPRPPRPRPRNCRAGRRACPLRPGPGGRVVRRGIAAFRGLGSHLGRRAALRRRQRPRHRHPLQDRRGGCRCRGRHHPRRHESSGRHSSGGC